LILTGILTKGGKLDKMMIKFFSVYTKRGARREKEERESGSIKNEEQGLKNGSFCMISSNVGGGGEEANIV
jgi:hypothetical protein